MYAIEKWPEKLEEIREWSLGCTGVACFTQKVLCRITCCQGLRKKRAVKV